MVWSYQRLVDVAHPAAYICPVCCRLPPDKLALVGDGLMQGHLRALGGERRPGPPRETHPRYM